MLKSLNLAEFLGSKRSKGFLLTLATDVIAAAALDYLGVPIGLIELVLQLVTGLGAVYIGGVSLSDAFGKGKIEARLRAAVESARAERR